MESIIILLTTTTFETIVLDPHVDSDMFQLYMITNLYCLVDLMDHDGSMICLNLI